MTKGTKQINYTELQKEELTTQQSLLLDKAKEATQNAYAPYSNFQVGAAILLDNNEIVTGSNQENAAYPSGLCAERVAIFAAHHLYPKAKIVSLAIAATDHGKALAEPIVPCAACRQVMAESIKRGKASFEVLLQGANHILVIPDALDLIPFHFEM